MDYSCIKKINITSYDTEFFSKKYYRDMEIIYFVLKGSIRQELKNLSITTLNSNDFQITSTGSGIYCETFENKNTNKVEAVQILIEPNLKGQIPTYQKKNFPSENSITHIASPDGKNNTLQIKQNINLYLLQLDAFSNLKISSKYKKQYIYSIKGALKANNNLVSQGSQNKIKSIDKSFSYQTESHKVIALIFEEESI